MHCKPSFLLTRELIDRMQVFRLILNQVFKFRWLVLTSNMTFVFEFEYLVILPPPRWHWTCSSVLSAASYSNTELYLWLHSFRIWKWCFQQYIYDDNLFKFFKLNNSAFFAENNDSCKQSFDEMFLKMGPSHSKISPKNSLKQRALAFL